MNNSQKMEMAAEALYSHLLPRLGRAMITVGFGADQLFVHVRERTTFIPTRYKGLSVKTVVIERAKPAASA